MRVQKKFILIIYEIDMKYKQKRYIQRIGNKQSISFEIFDKIKELVPNHKELIFVDLF
jgi:hypothetical protein